jgi:hypothetical protein
MVLDGEEQASVSAEELASVEQLLSARARRDGSRLLNELRAAQREVSNELSPGDRLYLQTLQNHQHRLMRSEADLALAISTPGTYASNEGSGDRHGLQTQPQDLRAEGQQRGVGVALGQQRYAAGAPHSYYNWTGNSNAITPTASTMHRAAAFAPSSTSTAATTTTAPINATNTTTDVEECDDEGAPEAFFCPITCQVMKVPVVAADGHSYDRDAIHTWLASKDKSPMTGALLPSKMLTPNHLLKSMISDWRDKMRAIRQ